MLHLLNSHREGLFCVFLLPIADCEARYSAKPFPINSIARNCEQEGLKFTIPFSKIFNSHNGIFEAL